jgi:hypothetical protein
MVFRHYVSFEWPRWYALNIIPMLYVVFILQEPEHTLGGDCTFWRATRR